MLPVLPYELHELICSHLQDLYTSLGAYSLTCRQFHRIASKYLFGKITLTLSPTKTDSFSKLLISSSQISALVHTLSIEDKPELQIHQPQAHLYGFDDTIFATEALPHLVNLKTFSLASTGFRTLLWPAMFGTMTTPLRHIFHHNLAHLALYRIIDVPIELLEGCTVLEELSLVFVTFPTHEMEQISSELWGYSRRHTVSKLVSLKLALSDATFDFFSRWITSPKCGLDISKLQRLSATMSFEYHDHGHVNRIVQACTSTLEIFCFSPAFLGTIVQLSSPINAHLFHSSARYSDTYKLGRHTCLALYPRSSSTTGTAFTTSSPDFQCLSLGKRLYRPARAIKYLVRNIAQAKSSQGT